MKKNAVISMMLSLMIVLLAVIAVVIGNALAQSLSSNLGLWLNSALKGVAGTQMGIIEVDSTGDGQITAADATNSQMGAWLNVGTLDDAFVNARQSKYLEKSPWNPAQSLFVSGAANTSVLNQIAISQNAAGMAPLMQVVRQKAGCIAQ